MMLAVFFGHGNPLNAVADNEYTRGWARLGSELPKPKAILSISAHWSIPQTAVTISETPRTIHDFGSFPRELYKVQYPAPGDAGLVERVQEILAPRRVTMDDDWGLDHGTWAVLCHAYPNAHIPMVQLSIDESQPASFHYELGKALAPLREEDVLIIGSGNIVHNLHTYAWGRHQQAPFDWAISFEKKVREALLEEDHDSLVHYETKLGAEARLAVPTPEHYLPLLYVIGACAPSQPVTFPVQGIDGGSVSMLTLKVGR
jgi:4,5-DOPA dioxygenase extradiol